MKYGSINKGTVVAISVMLLIGLTGLAHADSFFDPPPLTAEETALNTRHLAQLRAGQYADLDRDMNQIQRDFEGGKRSDINLLHLFRAFYDTDPRLEEKYKSWISAYPKSYAAREARGIYYRRVGYERRGSSYVGETSDRQLTEMESYLHASKADHQAAMALTTKPLLTCYDVMSNAKLLGDQQLAVEMLKTSIRIMPKNFIVRYKYMLMFETRWGGSLDAMKQFRQDAKAAGLPSDQMTYFDHLIADEVEWLRAER